MSPTSKRSSSRNSESRSREGELAFLFAHDGVEALSALAENGSVDMVLSDINMPRMDGLSLLAKLQEAEEKLSTVIVSAYGDMANIRTAINSRRLRFPHEADRLHRSRGHDRQDIRHIDVLREARRRQLAAERAHAMLSRYFSPNLAERLASDASTLDLGGKRREVAALFTDIAGFTNLVENLDPALLSEVLNEYLCEMTDVVFEHEGTVAKIVGDAIHVLFGAPGDQPDHSTRAVACTLALDECSERFRGRWAKRGVTLGPTRIGVHTGPAIVGNFGGGRFFDYTAYGDTINTAARLEAANKVLGTRICVSADVAEQAEGFRGRPVGDLVLRGKTRALRAFEPLSEEVYAHPATASYAEAFAKIEKGRSGSDDGLRGADGDARERWPREFPPQALVERRIGDGLRSRLNESIPTRDRAWWARQSSVGDRLGGR